MTVALLSLACWYFHISRIADRLGYDMGRGVVHLCWTCLETCLELPKSRYLISLYSDLMDEFEGSRRFDDHQENSSAAHESSRVIILKSLSNSIGHSACTSEVRDIFDRQTPVPDDLWQLMCSHILQTWDRRNSMTAPVRNITIYNFLRLNRFFYKKLGSIIPNFISVSFSLMVVKCSGNLPPAVNLFSGCVTDYQGSTKTTPVVSARNSHMTFGDVWKVAVSS